jgi:hypothetical protein
MPSNSSRQARGTGPAGLFVVGVFHSLSAFFTPRFFSLTDRQSPTRAPKLLSEIVPRLFELLKFVQEVASVNRNSLTAIVAGDTRVALRLELPDRYRSGTAALRARNIDGLIVEQKIFLSPLVVPASLSLLSRPSQ